MEKDEKIKKLIAERFEKLDRTMSLIIHEPEAQEISEAVKRHILASFKAPEEPVEDEGGHQ
jgi:hypothetical protein